MLPARPGWVFHPLTQHPHHFSSTLPSPSQVGRVTPGAGMSMACAGMALKPTSGPRSPCRLCGHRRDSLWAVGLATPWPSATCQPSLLQASAPRSLGLSQMPPRTPNLRCHGPKEKLERKTTRNLYPKPTWQEQKWGACDRDHVIKWFFPFKVFPENCFVRLWGWPDKGSGGSTVGLTTGWNAGRLPARCLELKETDILSIQQVRMGVRASGKDMESSRKAPGCPCLVRTEQPALTPVVVVVQLPLIQQDEGFLGHA